MLRSSYSTKVKFWRNSNQEVSIIWYFVNPGTPFVPFYNRFSSANWKSDQAVAWEGVGEVWSAPRPWRNGSSPAAFPAVHPCGGAAQWADGEATPSGGTVPPDWIPTCCDTVPTRYGLTFARLLARSIFTTFSNYASSSRLRVKATSGNSFYPHFASSTRLRTKASSSVEFPLDRFGSVRLRCKPFAVFATAANYSALVLLRVKPSSSYVPIEDRDGLVLLRVKAFNSTEGGTTHACGSCPGGAALSYTFTLSGATNGTCSDCANLNANWTLTYSSGCLWISGLFTLCGTNVQRWNFVRNPSLSSWDLKLPLAPDILYRASTSSWDCVTPLTLSLVTTPTRCSTLPSTVTLSPV